MQVTQWHPLLNKQQHNHENVTIIYPNDHTEPIIVECYIGEHMRFSSSASQVAQYTNKKGEIKIEFRVFNRKTGRLVERTLNTLQSTGTDIVGRVTAELIDKSMRP